MGRADRLARWRGAVVILSLLFLADGSECWNFGYEPLTCCHPRFADTGLPECWDEVYTARRCCNQSNWDDKEVVGYNLGLQESWFTRCREAYDDRPPGEWQGGVWQELLHWFYWLRGLTSEALREILDRPLEAWLQRAALRRPGGLPEKVRVLDVGSGPLSLIGRRWEGVAVELVAADPLSCYYGYMLHDLGVRAPEMETARAVGAERLVEAFGPESFDIVHCANALDHSHDPMSGIVDMVRVVRPGWPVCMEHRLDEAESNEYSGLHQWNFDIREQRLVLWQPTHRADRQAAALRADVGKDFQQDVFDVEAELVARSLVEPGGLEWEYREHFVNTEKLVLVSVVIWRRAGSVE